MNYVVSRVRGRAWELHYFCCVPQCCLFVAVTSTHAPPFLFAASWVELDLVFDVYRALSVVDCDDRYHNIMRFFVVTLAVAGGSRQTVNITITHGIANMGMEK